jgi:hypothetical protein
MQVAKRLIYGKCGAKGLEVILWFVVMVLFTNLSGSNFWHNDTHAGPIISLFAAATCLLLAIMRFWQILALLGKLFALKWRRSAT